MSNQSVSDVYDVIVSFICGEARASVLLEFEKHQTEALNLRHLNLITAGRGTAGTFCFFPYQSLTCDAPENTTVILRLSQGLRSSTENP